MPAAPAFSPKVPSTAQLVDLWDTARAESPAQRAQRMIALAFPDLPQARAAALPIGVRDSLLMAWRRLVFGDAVEAMARCPACGDAVEARFDGGDLYPAPPGAQDLPERTWDAGEWRVRFHVPTTADAAALTAASAADGRALAARCITEVRRGDALSDVGALPDEAWSAIAAQMLADDPSADVALALTCPQCAERWALGFDPVGFVWTEVSALARRAVTEVALLARAFGWSEGDILAMSPTRRWAYLELAGA